MNRPAYKEELNQVTELINPIVYDFYQESVNNPDFSKMREPRANDIFRYYPNEEAPSTSTTMYGRVIKYSYDGSADSHNPNYTYIIQFEDRKIHMNYNNDGFISISEE